jgi:hypothetical protein
MDAVWFMIIGMFVLTSLAMSGLVLTATDERREHDAHAKADAEARRDLHHVP